MAVYRRIIGNSICISAKKMPDGDIEYAVWDREDESRNKPARDEDDCTVKGGYKIHKLCKDYGFKVSQYQDWAQPRFTIKQSDLDASDLPKAPVVDRIREGFGQVAEIEFPPH